MVAHLFNDDGLRRITYGHDETPTPVQVDGQFAGARAVQWMEAKGRDPVQLVNALGATDFVNALSVSLTNLGLSIYDGSCTVFIVSLQPSGAEYDLHNAPATGEVSNYAGVGKFQIGIRIRRPADLRTTGRRHFSADCRADYAAAW